MIPLGLSHWGRCADADILYLRPPTLTSPAPMLVCAGLMLISESQWGARRYLDVSLLDECHAEMYGVKGKVRKIPDSTFLPQFLLQQSSFADDLTFTPSIHGTYRNFLLLGIS